MRSGGGFPTEPGCASHSVPEISVPAMRSVPPYASQIFSGPSHSIHARFSQAGLGAPVHITRRSDDTS